MLHRTPKILVPAMIVPLLAMTSFGGCSDDTSAQGTASGGASTTTNVGTGGATTASGGAGGTAGSGGTSNGAIHLDTLKAYPSAEGWAATTVIGGKGGKVLYVTSLANEVNGSYDDVTDTYSGTFRYIMGLPVSGYVIFRVAGVAQATNGAYAFDSGTGRKTIMGGTAPYPGVTLNGHQFAMGGANITEQVQIRGLSFMMGGNLPDNEVTALKLRWVDNWIVADCTLGWTSDETIGGGNNQGNATIQRNLFLEGHPEHNTAILAGAGDHTDWNGTDAYGFSVADNVFIHNSHRMPNSLGLWTTNIDVINNVSYNYGGNRIIGMLLSPKLNVVNNYYLPGPNNGTPRHKWNASDYQSPYADYTNHPIQIYNAGAVAPGHLDGTEPNNNDLWVQHITAGPFTADEPLPPDWFVTSPFPYGTDANVKTAQSAYEYNLLGKNVGARYYTDENGVRVKYFPDYIDAYLEDGVQGTDVAFRKDASQFVLPSIPDSGEPYVDDDHDGMADAWEQRHGLDVTRDDKEETVLNWTIDGRDFVNNAGFTNIQMFDDYVHGGFVALSDRRE